MDGTRIVVQFILELKTVNVLNVRLMRLTHHSSSREFGASGKADRTRRRKVHYIQLDLLLVLCNFFYNCEFRRKECRVYWVAAIQNIHKKIIHFDIFQHFFSKTLKLK